MYVMPTVFFAPTLQPDQQSPQYRQAYCITPETFGPGLWEIVIGGHTTRRPAPSSRCPSLTTASAQPALPNLPKSGRSTTPALISEPPPRPVAPNTVSPFP